MVSLKEFETLARNFNVIPLVQPMLSDVLTPVSAYMSLKERGRASFLFESVEPNARIGRYSFVGIDPQFMVTSKGEEVSLVRDGKRELLLGDIFSALARMSERYRVPTDMLPSGFWGGFVGYIGYDCVRHLENIHLPDSDGMNPLDAMMGLFTDVVRFDHQSQMLTVVHNVCVTPDRPLTDQYAEGVNRLEVLQLRLRRPSVVTTGFSCSDIPSPTDKETFCRSVERAKEYIHEGDIFQVVLSRRLFVDFTGDPFAVYRALRLVNPSPYLFFLDFGDVLLIGSSPEVLVRVQAGVVDLLPIAGTRPRGAGEDEDGRLERELLQNEKELAEHTMLVDLGRNDVGRVSSYGSVEVPVFKRVEKYSHVMHIVSQVRGKLRPGCSALDAFGACFPAGTVSGAPKVRAMEIITELEGERRGVYAGAVGYLGFNGDLDTCIAIRTIIAHGNTLSIQAGAGIVADSMPEEEFQETVNKARALTTALKLAADGLKLDGKLVETRR